MSLNAEYSRKIDRFIATIPRRMYSACEQVEFNGFITRERMTLEEACAHEKMHFSEGTKWGKKYEYGWFFTEVTIPTSCEGKRVVFKAGLGECLVFVNGKIYGSLDKEHFEITLSDNAKAGEHFEIAMEVYAGHAGPIEPENTTNVLPSTRVVIPEENITEFPVDIEQKVITNGSFGVFHEELFQLWMDIKTLYELRCHFEWNSWRQANIDKCLQEVCDVIDIEAPIALLCKMSNEGRKVMKPILSCRNGSSAPTLYAVGNSHLDLEWLWTKEETRRKAARTLGNQLRLLEEYDDYLYMHSQPWLLETIKNEYPELYDEIKTWISKGRIIVEGGMWVESDTNIPSGESLIRQFIFGKGFISKEFGTDSEILWLPDIFGCSAVLPQLMKGCGIKYFMNAKLLWQYDGGDPFPRKNFIWRGLDGSEVLTHITGGYSSGATPHDNYSKWNDNQDKANVPTQLYLYGYGDGGGGATRVDQEYIRREEDLEGLPKVQMAAPNKFFHVLENECEINYKYNGELYYAAHRGTYTSQAKTKKLNRQSERMLREAEMWTTLFGCKKRDEINLLWKEVLFNHFHDVIPGSSITEVYERAEKSYEDVIFKANEITDTALSSVLQNTEDTLTVFNSLSWERKVLTMIPDGYKSICDSNGNYAETQTIDGKTIAFLEVPACGVKSYKLLTGEESLQSVVDHDLYLENNLIRATFNEQGELVSVVDKSTGIEFLAEVSNKFRMYQDAPTFFDAWDIDSFYEKLETTDVYNVEVKIENRGELVSSLLIKKMINNSQICQRVLLRKDSRRIDFETEVEWNETHRLLKVDFNTNIHTSELISEIQFGHLKRPNHKNRQHDRDRFEVWQHKWSALAEGNRGVAILNDCKYGISADEGKMSLTLLKAAAAPALHADKGVHQFTYSLMPFLDTFFNSNVIQEAYELNYPVNVKVGESEDKSLLRVSEKNVIIETVKQSEDGTGDIIIRLYETQNSFAKCKLEFGFDVEEVYITDMLEKSGEKVEIYNNSVNLTIKAFEIVTLRVRKV